VKVKTSRRGLEKGILACLSAGILFSVCPTLRADDLSQLASQSPGDPADAAASGSAAKPTGASDPYNLASPDDVLATGSSGIDLPSLGASPSLTPSSDGQMTTPGDETPLPSPTPEAAPEATPPPESETAPEPAPEVDVEPSLPGGLNTQEAANGVPLPANPALQQQYSEWDLAQIESPLFLNAVIDEFNERPLQLTGNWSLKPHLSIGTTYNGNIFLQSQNKTSDVITHFAPGVAMRLGNDDSMFYMMADYTAGANYYIQHPGESSVDQDGRAQFQWSMPKTTVGLTLAVSSDKGQDVDAGTLVRRNLYFAGLTTHYAYSDKTSWDVSGAYTRDDFGNLISDEQWEGDVFLNYQYSPKTQVGIGGSGGYTVVPGSPSQIFEEANARTTYRATGKLTLIGEVGAQLRQFASGKAESVTPVFILESAWQARPGTKVDLTARRSIYASAILQDQNYTATSVDLDITQRITDYWGVSLGAGFVNSDYTATTNTVTASREDNYYYIRPAVEWNALTWLSVGIFYEYDQDLSKGGQANSFTRDSGGLDLAILF
jgi:hypothetical protein